MKESENAFDKIFPEKDFNQRLKSFANHLKIKIDNFDTDANWSEAHFTPLEAEVEVYSARGKTKKIANLLDAIKRDHKSKVFLVLGEPGSGKSVALRKLCRDLNDEIVKTRKIPIYLNLKEWLLNKQWTEEHPPKQEDLFDFCVSFLKEGGNAFSDDFVDLYFKRLYENGHVFFIIDSFDEIPSVLDEDESSWLIDKLSEILYAFLGGAHESRGILSSRYFRKPTIKFRADTILNIRPFSDHRINQALNKYIAIDKEVIKTIFKERLDLLPIASNPFSVGLIYSYLKDNQNKLPLNQADLYSSYISNRLDKCKEKIHKKNLDKPIIIKYATEIAAFMFDNPNLGLEASISNLKAKFNDVNIEDIIDVLVYAKIGRLGKGEEKRFSYVHRRFNEYFVIQKYLLNPELVDLTSIPNDSRYRDALVLYCEIASDEHNIKIANFCWDEIKLLNEKNTGQLLRSIHCLRFVIEAFRNRTNALHHFSDDLSKFILDIIKQHDSYNNSLIPKIAVEALGIMNRNEMEEALVLSFKINNWWVNQTALKASRHLSSINIILRDEIINSILKLDYVLLLSQKKELLFTLSVSESFKQVKIYTICKIFDIYIFYMGFILLLFIYPLTTIFIALLSVFIVKSIFYAKKIKTIESNFILLLAFRSLFCYMFFFTFSLLLLNSEISLIYFGFVLVIIIFPFLNWLSIFYLVLNDKIQRKRIFEKILVVFLYFIPIAYVFYYCVTEYIQYIEKIAEIITNSSLLIFFIIVLGLIILGFLVKIVVDNIKDFLFLKSLVTKENDNREDIVIRINKIKTAYFRKKYVNILEQEVLICRGYWPEDFSLNKNESAYILLAQLDEKWLGLSVR